MDLQTIQTFVSTTLIDVLLKMAAAVVFWLAGRWLVQRITDLVQAGMSRNHVDPTLTKYLSSIVGVALNVALGLGILGFFGIETTSFAALIAGAGLAIGAAWGGLLSNFAAGAFMLVLRPFKVGDVVSVGGVTGTVHELGLFGTTIITPDNVMTLVGNNKIFGDTVQNYSTLPVRRVDRTAQFMPGVDPLEAIARLRAAVARIPNVAQVPPPDIHLLELNASGPLIAVQPYTPNAHYAQVQHDTNVTILKVCQAAGWKLQGME